MIMISTIFQNYFHKIRIWIGIDIRTKILIMMIVMAINILKRMTDALISIEMFIKNNVIFVIFGNWIDVSIIVIFFMILLVFRKK